MRSFLKFFLASFVALIIFSILFLLLLVGWIGGLTRSQKPETGAKAVLMLDLSQEYRERMQQNPLGNFSSDQYDVPGIYDLIRLVAYAKQDTAIKGIYVKCDGNPNGFASSEEIRNALIDFKRSGKFIFAYGDVIPQKAFYVGSVADKIYCNPKGGVEWKGLASVMPFLKGALDKLEIEPQIFYAGKFKSATEPLREIKMTDANRLQTTELLNDLYNRMIYKIASARSLDTGVLRKCVNESLIRFPSDAARFRFVDGLKYDDQVRNEIKGLLRLGANDKINFISAGKYAEAVRTNFKRSGNDHIALIYAEGDITGGKNDELEIGGEAYRNLIRRVRMDKDVKALVLRINSGGGSALISENLWRELTITRKEKPVVISFGDVAASGAYYLSCNADSIFAEPNTITGSIGVFTVLPNMQKFFKNKLGVTFDGVKTAPDADMMSITKPLTEMQRRFVQSEIDGIYNDFKTRVSEGRNKSMEFVDSIGQGRVWSGERAIQLGLVDRLGGLQEAIDCAARMAKTTDYRLKEYPEPKNIFDLLFGNYRRSAQTKMMKEELGEEEFQVFQSLKKLKAMIGTTQARIPVEINPE
ncbi:MAG: signal peptide peptidase SppA [Bacteroidetes bacterium]|nr:MAG: signal peptide peptidase SppA [Bacteroidota bacterium]